jgi:glycerol-3-phosphate dehydrogenase
VRLVKGSHIIVPKFWQGDHAYLLQNDDKRVIFVNPYEGNLCLIGTTDISYNDSPDQVVIDDTERDYLLRVVNRYMRHQLAREDVLHAYSGVRPLYDDNARNPSAVTRDYVFDVDGAPPVLSIFGGKITTYRKLAEHALQKLAPHFSGSQAEWTATEPLPGGDLPNADFDEYLSLLRARYPWLTPDLAHHYARLYGTRAEKMLDGAASIDGLGQHFGGHLYEREADFLIRTEWARQPEDVLERRTKHHLHMTPAQRDAFAAWMARAA